MRFQHRPDLQSLYRLLAPNAITEIVDIGANPINPAPYSELVDLKLARVFGFEPQEKAYEALKNHESGHQRFLPYAIGDGRAHTLRVCRGSGFSSLLEPSIDFAEYVNHFRHKMEVTKRIEILTKRLDDVSELPAPDLIKIDIQGAETMVFENAQNALSHAVAIITEAAFVPLYENQPLLDAQMQILRDHGFVLHKFIDPVRVPLRGTLQRGLGSDALRNQLVDSDAVFIRPVPADTQLETEKLKHLALLGAGAIKSLDLTLRCLDILIDRTVVDADRAADWINRL